ncbi:MAG: RNA methyltransferase [Parvibaculaceae bacterium]|nr:RNA methyltransferase [Parvibaculaceae bacterium]
MTHAQRPPKRIDSRDNPRAKLWASLLTPRGLKKAGQFILAGRKTVPEALRTYPRFFETLLVTSPAQLTGWTLPPGLEVIEAGSALFQELDTSGTGFPLLIGTVPEMAQADLTAAPRGLELICGLSDPSNLGALLRSAAAFGAARVVLLTESAHPFHPKALRAAANAQFSVELVRGPSWSELTAEAGHIAGPVLALDAGGADLAAFTWPHNVRLLLGEEGLGVPPALDVARLTVPTTGAVESLNATVAASVALYAYHTAHGK